MKKIPKFSEGAWIVATVFLSLAVCLMTKAGYGVSMIVSPAYVLHLALVKIWPWFTFGVAEYVVQAVIVGIMCLAVRRFRWQYLLSFLAGVIYGLLLDGWTWLFGAGVYGETYERVLCFVAGLVLTGFAIAFFFRTGLPIQAYDMFVAEVAKRYKWKKGIVKWVYDFSMLTVALVMTLCINKGLVGIGIGTVICTVVNAPIISVCGKIIDNLFDFSCRFPRLDALLSGQIYKEVEA